MLALTRYLQMHIAAEQVAAVVQAKICGSPAVASTMIVDVRSTGEVATTGVIPTAVNIPLSLVSAAFSDEMDEEEFSKTFGVPKPQKGVTQLIFYCAHGVRSAVATDIVEDLGYTGAKNFDGSFAEWCQLYGTSTGGCGESNATGGGG